MAVPQVSYVTGNLYMSSHYFQEQMWEYFSHECRILRIKYACERKDILNQLNKLKREKIIGMLALLLKRALLN